jgi:phage terminase small subunit
MVKKPANVAADPAKSAKWDELTAGRRFKQSDVPTLALLVEWYAVVDSCIADLDAAHGEVTFENNMGDIKPLPQLSTMKQASAEIRQLNKQLGIVDGGEDADSDDGGGEVLRLVEGNRAARKQAAKG